MVNQQSNVLWPSVLCAWPPGYLPLITCSNATPLVAGYGSRFLGSALEQLYENSAGVKIYKLRMLRFGYFCLQLLSKPGERKPTAATVVNASYYQRSKLYPVATYSSDYHCLGEQATLRSYGTLMLCCSHGTQASMVTWWFSNL